MASIFSWVGIAKAELITTHVDKNKAIDGSVYSTGEQIQIAGLVNGDVYCAGETVKISGVVKGDVLCAANQLEVSGTVEGDIRAAANELKLTGTVGRSVTLAGSNVLIEKSAKIGQDATLAGALVELRGSVGRDLVAGSGETQLYGTVGRNVMANGQTIALKDKAKVAGNIRYESNNSITIGDNATVAGDVHRKPADKSQGFNAGYMLMAALAMLFFAVVLVLLWPQLVHATNEIAVRNLGKTMLVGALAPFATILAIIILSVSIIGIPVAIFVLLASMLIALLSGPVAAYYFGSMILSKSKNPVAIMLVGATVLLIAYAIPVVGGIALVAAFLIGSGAILLKLKRSSPNPVYQVD